MAEPTAQVAMQFDDPEQQEIAATLGMWAFLATEVLFFGGMLLAYVVYRHTYPEAFAQASRELNVRIGTINTAVLLTSSFTMALSVRAAQLGRAARLRLFLVLTLVLGLLFLSFKGYEYYDDFQKHLVLGADFPFQGAHARQMQLFLFIYYVMTAVHALHLTIGIGVVAFLLIRAGKGRFSSEYYTPVELGGLYWHFVDIVWIFLYPMLYLIDRYSK